MKYNIISSSSAGNSIVVEDIILLDAGVSFSKLKPYLKKIKLIFISHSHKDHLNRTTIKHIAFEYPTIKYICGSIEAIGIIKECGVKPKNIYFLKPYKKYNLGLLKVKLEELIHDKHNCALKWEYKGKKGIYMVDTASTNNIVAKDYDLYLIEANYKEKELKKHRKECEDPNKLYYFDRVVKSHLSYENANTFLIENMGKNSVYEYIHKSNYNFKGDE